MNNNYTDQWSDYQCYYYYYKANFSSSLTFFGVFSIMRQQAPGAYRDNTLCNMRATVHFKRCQEALKFHNRCIVPTIMSIIIIVIIIIIIIISSSNYYY